MDYGIRTPKITRKPLLRPRRWGCFLPASLIYFLTGSRNISYDMVCRAMRETGVNLDHRFRETSEGGLARLYNRKKKL